MAAVRSQEATWPRSRKISLRLEELAGGEWRQFDFYAAFRCVPAVAIPLLLGVATGHARTTVLITAGAFSAGFGSFQELQKSHVLPMVLAALGMCVSSWAGTLAGNSNIAAVLLCTGAAFVYAYAFRFGRSASWLALQCAIWLVISTAYAAHGVEALSRGSLILVGGFLQTGLAVAWRQMKAMRPAASGGEQPAQKQAQNALPGDAWHLFAIRASVTIAIAAALYRWLSVQNGYWIPVTSLIVMRPGLRETLQRGTGRAVGTLLGVAVAALMVSATSHSAWVMTAGVVLFAWGSYALFRVSYAYFAACLTAYVVFLLSLAGIREEPLIVHRILFTLIGAALSLGTHWIPAWLRNHTA